MYATSFKVIIPGFGFSAMGIFHLAVFNLLSVLGMHAHYKAMTTDPGAVPKHAIPLEDDVQETNYALDMAEMSTRGPKYKKFCKKCKSFKPMRAHHCSMCGRCIIKMDHHCPWVNNCIGLGNHKLFLLFLFWVFASCLYSIVLVIVRYTLCSIRHNCGTELNVAVVFLMVESILFGLFTLCMMGDQLSNISTNTTQIDRLKNTFYAQEQTDVDEVFGSHPEALCHYSWFVPEPVKLPSDHSIRSRILGYQIDPAIDGIDGLCSGIEKRDELDPLIAYEPATELLVTTEASLSLSVGVTSSEVVQIGSSSLPIIKDEFPYNKDTGGLGDTRHQIMSPIGPCHGDSYTNVTTSHAQWKHYKEGGDDSSGSGGGGSGTSTSSLSSSSIRKRAGVP